MNVLVFKRDGRKFYQLQWNDPVTGKQKTRSAKTPNRREAERLAIEVENDLQAGGTGRDDRTAWDEFVDRYSNDVLSGKAENTKTKVNALCSLLEKIIDPQSVQALNAQQISRFTRALRERKNSEASIKGYLAHLKGMLNWAKRMEMIPRTPHIEMPTRVPTNKGRAITAEELDRLLEKLDDPKVGGPEKADQYKNFVRGLWWSGLRLGEAMKLQWVDDRDICVDLSGKRPMLRIRAHAEKGNKNRTLPIVPEFAEMLYAVPEAERDGFVFKLENRRNKLRPTSKTVEIAIAKAGKLAQIKVAESLNGKIKWASAHDMRRAFGTRWAKRISAVELRKIMRHKDIKTTLEYYVDDDAEATADLLWNAVSKAEAKPANTSTDISNQPDSETSCF